MGIVTRVDADIQHYFQVILEQDHVEEGDIQRLLDAYREKFEVDFVYVGEVLVDRKGLFFTHVSASCPRYNLLGRSHAFREDWESAAAYDVEGLSREIFERAKPIVFSEPQVDVTWDETFPEPRNLHALLAEAVGEGVVLLLGLPEIGDIVKQQTPQLAGYQVLQLLPRPVKHYPLQRSNFTFYVNRHLAPSYLSITKIFQMVYCKPRRLPIVLLYRIKNRQQGG